MIEKISLLLGRIREEIYFVTDAHCASFIFPTLFYLNLFCILHLVYVFNRVSSSSLKIKLVSKYNRISSESVVLLLSRRCREEALIGSLMRAPLTLYLAGS